MKFRTILATLLLPCVASAQEVATKPQSDTPTKAAYNYLAPLDVLTGDQTSDYTAQYLPNVAYVVSAQSKMRVNLDLRNAPLKEAIRQLKDQTKQEFVLESDVPADARVTVVAKNIRLSTALEMVSDATGLNWNQQKGRKSDGKEATTVFHIGKKVSRSLFQWDSPLSWLTPYLRYNENGNKFYDLKGQDKNFKPMAGLKFAPDNATNLSATYTLANTLIQTNKVAEVRSTFTCPHCKQQVTVIHQHQSPKCDQCGRVFHDDWQFCPFDGAKRPATAGIDWQFCPICGKSVKPEGKAEVKLGSPSWTWARPSLRTLVKPEGKAEIKPGN